MERGGEGGKIRGRGSDGGRIRGRREGTRGGGRKGERGDVGREGGM